MEPVKIEAPCPRCGCNELHLVSVSKIECVCGESFGAHDLWTEAFKLHAAIDNAWATAHAVLRREREAKEEAA